MTSNVDLLPLPETRFWADSMKLDAPGVFFEHRSELFVKLNCQRTVEFDQPLYTADQVRANVAHATAAKDAEIEALRAEVEGLRQAVADNITDSTMLRHMKVIDGGLSLGLVGGGAQLLAEAFAHQFMGSGAINFLELTFTHEELGKLVVTLQRAEGLTPADKAKAAEARAERLAEDIRGIYAAMPGLPITPETMDSATDVLARFCIDFNDVIFPHPTAAQEDGRA